MKKLLLALGMLLAPLSVFPQQQADSIAPQTQPPEQPLPATLAAEDVPESNFRGGNIYDFVDFVQARLKYPQYAYERGIEAEVPVTFVVRADGSITDVEYRGNTPAKDYPDHIQEMIAEAIRVVASAPKWTPATTTPDLPKRFTIPVEFAMPLYDGGFDLEKPRFTYRTADEILANDTISNEAAIKQWLESRMTIPEDFAILFTAVIEKSGILSNIKLSTTSDDEAAAKVIAALDSIPKWTPGKMDGELVRTRKHISLNFRKDDDAVFVSEKMPEFQGGDLATFRDWVMSRLVYPPLALSNNIEGRVILGFVIEKDGSLSNIEVMSSRHIILTNEAIRVVRRSPKWTPGRNKNKPVRVAYLLPIEFRLRP